MSERRSPDPDRRAGYRGGRRSVDYDHGTRSLYQRGCRCLLCRAAEAAYRADLRRQQAHGKLQMGALVDARAMWRLIAVLLNEQYRKGQLALLLGMKRPILRLGRAKVTRETDLKVRRLYRLRYLE